MGALEKVNLICERALWYELVSGVTGTFQNEVIGLTSCQDPHGSLGTFVETLILEIMDKGYHGPELSSERTIKIRLCYAAKPLAAACYLKPYFSNQGTCSSEDGLQ